MTSRVDIIKGEKDKITLKKKNEIVADYQKQISDIKSLNGDASHLEEILKEIQDNLF